jgi:predicted 3-demethylubiquinone-9 3-methyltransferase (glyoxalase superfamily)
MQKIVPHLWFDKEAKEAAEFYVSAFGGDSKVKNVTTLHNTPSGDADIVSFEIMGFPFMAISAGPLFKFNPSISFFVNFDPSRDTNARENLDKLWEKLSAGGSALMPLQEYPFSKHYGWIQDKYGLSWQLMLTNPEGEERPTIIPSLMFTGDNTGKADEAIDFYVSTFKDSKRGMSAPYPPGAAPEKNAKLMFAEFMLENQWFTAMDSGHMHKFGFNEAVSLMVRCKDQEEIDYYSEKLSAVPEADLPAPRPDTYYVYVILCDDDSMYIGQTQDILNRWREHKAGTGADHTKKHKPDKIIHFEEFASREEAVKREHDLKTGFGRKWLKRAIKAGRTRQAGQCGWIKDKYGVSWQIVPTDMDKMMTKGTPEQIDRITQAFLPMKRFDLAKLKEAYEG